jgi:hypothetical protein
MLIEERESAEAISAETLNDAMFTLMHARMVCHEGHVVDALAIYNKVAQSLPLSPLQRANGNETDDALGQAAQFEVQSHFLISMQAQEEAAEPARAERVAVLERCSQALESGYNSACNHSQSIPRIG